MIYDILYIIRLRGELDYKRELTSLGVK